MYHDRFCIRNIWYSFLYCRRNRFTSRGIVVRSSILWSRVKQIQRRGKALLYYCIINDRNTPTRFSFLMCQRYVITAINFISRTNTEISLDNLLEYYLKHLSWPMKRTHQNKIKVKNRVHTFWKY